MSSSSNNQNREFYCFISYKHRDEEKFMLDEEWAEALAFSLTQLHIPAETKPPIIDDAFINLNPKDDVIYPVFRDFEVLGAGERFTERIVIALKHSRKLVVVISDEMIEDQEKFVNRKIPFDKEERYLNAWCFREIFCFLKDHTPDDILPVYIGSKKDIQDIIPSVLTLGLRKRDVNSGRLTAKQKKEYEESIKYWRQRNIAIVYPNGVQKSVKELRDFFAAKIAANIFGTDTDQFRNYQMAEEEKRQAEKKKNKLQRWFAAIIAFIIFSISIVSHQINTAQVFLAEARQSLSFGNRKEAMAYTLSAYKKWPRTADLTQFMWDVLEPRGSFMAFDSEVAMSPSSNEFAAMRENQYIDVYDGASLHIVATYDIGHGGHIVFSPNGEKLAVYTETDISIVDRARATITNEQNDHWLIKDVQFSPDGKYIYCNSFGLCKADNLQQQILSPTKEEVISFLGTNDQVAFIRHVCNLNEKHSSDSVWTISIFNLSKQDSLAAYRPGDFFFELPDSVSNVHAYNSKPVLFTTSNRGVSFFRFDGQGLTQIGWRRYKLPLNQGKREKWPNLPYRINKIISRPNVDGFILHSDRGVSFRLDSLFRISTVVAANVNSDGSITTYRGKTLAVGDSLNLVADDYGHLFLMERINPDEHGNLAHLGSVPLSGLAHEEDRTYSLAKLGKCQFVSQSHRTVSGWQTKTLMFWNKDTREIPTLISTNKQWCRYTSPDLRFAIIIKDGEFGVLDTQDKAFIPVCSTSMMSSKQDVPLYVSTRGEDVYVLSARSAQDKLNAVKYGLVQVNLPSKTASVLVENMDNFSKISEGVIIGQSRERTYLIDLRKKLHIEEYAGWLEIANKNGLHSVFKRIPITESSAHIESQPLLYDYSTGTLIPAPDSTGKYYTSPRGSFCIKETLEKDKREYEVSDLHSLKYIMTVVTDSGNQTISGVSENERYFVYALNACLSIFDFETKKEINTVYRVNPTNTSKFALANEHLFLPSNTYRVIEMKSAETKATVPEIQIENQQICFSPDEKWMLAGQYLINIEEGNIVSNSIPYGYNRMLSNDNILYMNKRLALPRKKALAKQISAIINEELR